MKIPPHIKSFGNLDFRGECPKEDAELITFFNQLKLNYPDLYDVAIHPDNERLISGTGFNAQSRQKAKGQSGTVQAILLLLAIRLLSVS